MPPGWGKRSREVKGHLEKPMPCAMFFNGENYRQYSDEELQGGQGEMGEEEVITGVPPSFPGSALSERPGRVEMR